MAQEDNWRMLGPAVHFWENVHFSNDQLTEPLSRKIMFNLKQTKNPNTSLQTLLVETPWSAADYYKEYYLKIQENVSNST